MPPMRMIHPEDPAKPIWDKVGSLDSFELFNNQALVAIYKRPERTTGGIILTDSTRDEDLWQGKVGIILKVGPSAFVEDTEDQKWFAGSDIGVGDWVIFRPSDGWPLGVHGQECRILQDIHVKGRISGPDEIW